MTAWTGALPFFSEQELSCRGSGVIKLHPTFAAALPALRLAWGPLTPTSVCRTPEHNEAIGGHPRSLHLTDNAHRDTEGTAAADLLWNTWESERRLDFARLAWDLGWSIGLHPTFVHVDRRRDIGLRQRVFIYGPWDGSFGATDITEFI